MLFSAAISSSNTSDSHTTWLCWIFDTRVFHQSRITSDEASGKKKKSNVSVMVWNVNTKQKRIPLNTETLVFLGCVVQVNRTASCSVYGWQPYLLHAPTAQKSGRLKLLEPSAPDHACNVTYVMLSHCNCHTKNIKGIFLSKVNNKNKFKLALKRYLLHNSFYSLEEDFNT